MMSENGREGPQLKLALHFQQTKYGCSLKSLAFDRHIQPITNAFGGIQATFGHLTEGGKLLEIALMHSEDALERAYNSLFLAIAEHRLGNRDRALQHAVQARGLTPDLPALNRLSELGIATKVSPS